MALVEAVAEAVVGKWNAGAADREPDADVGDVGIVGTAVGALTV